MNRNALRTVLLCISAALLNGCGGGGAGGGSGTNAPLGSGIEGSGREITSSGGVTGKGSIFVNGVEYDLAGADITVDGDPAAEADIDVGDVVIVEGELDTNGTTGSATRVTAGIAVAGPISAVDVALERLTILGQTVVVENGTRIINGDDTQLLGGLSVGDQVEVSGFADSSGVVFARRISPRRASTPLRAKGYAERLDATNHRFAINGQIVDYTNAEMIGFAGRDLAGAPVRVDADTTDGHGALLATEVVYREPRLPGSAGDGAVVQGWITRFASESDFDVDGHPVVTTPSTIIDGPTNWSLGAVRLDTFVVVTGRLTSSGAVEASKISMGDYLHEDARIISVDATRLKTTGGWLAEWSCSWTPDTVVRIDGLPANAEALRVGELATVLASYPGSDLTSTAICRIVTVEHNIRGVLESKPNQSAAFHVMGQRVWMGSSAVGAELAELDVGDVVEVSGHTTAEGDILAMGIQRATIDGSYRVIGFAHEIDDVAKRFQLGGLTIDYSHASLGGFADGIPAERDRVLVVSEIDAPSGSALTADFVRYAARLPRGAAFNFVGLGGLVTRFASREDFDVEGRKVIPMDAVLVPPNPESFDTQCAWWSVRPNQRLGLLTIGRPILPSFFVRATCPYDRTGYPPYWNGPLQVRGNVQAIDLDARSVRVGDVNLMLHPATQLTRFGEEDRGGGGYAAASPLALEELHVDQVITTYGTDETIEGGIRLVDAILTNTDEPPSESVSIRTGVESLNEPDIVLNTGIRIRVLPTTEFVFSNCDGEHNHDRASFFVEMRDWDEWIEVEGQSSSAEIVPATIRWGDTGACDG